MEIVAGSKCYDVSRVENQMQNVVTQLKSQDEKSGFAA